MTLCPFACLLASLMCLFCFFRWFDVLRSIDLLCRCIMRKKSKLMFANVRLFHRVAHECLESLFFQLTLCLDLRAFARVFRKFILSIYLFVEVPVTRKYLESLFFQTTFGYRVTHECLES